MSRNRLKYKKKVKKVKKINNIANRGICHKLVSGSLGRYKQCANRAIERARCPSFDTAVQVFEFRPRRILRHEPDGRPVPVRSNADNNIRVHSINSRQK